MHVHCAAAAGSGKSHCQRQKGADQGSHSPLSGGDLGDHAARSQKADQGVSRGYQVSLVGRLLMKDFDRTAALEGHSHVFLGTGHERNERKTWAVIVLCSLMMLVEIVGGSVYGSLALVADGLHMSTHAGAMLIAALAYTYARRHAHDARFVFGTGKLGDLAGFSSAIVLAMIAVLIGYEAIFRFLSPIPIHFTEAIPIAVVGLIVNIVSAWLLSGSEHHGHGHGHNHAEHQHESESVEIATAQGVVADGRHDVTFEEHSHEHAARAG